MKKIQYLFKFENYENYTWNNYKFSSQNEFSYYANEKCLKKNKFFFRRHFFLGIFLHDSFQMRTGC